MAAARQQIRNKQQLNINRGTVFSVQSVPKCYNQGNLWESEVQCREVKSLELESVKWRVEGWCEMAASLGVSQLEQ
jgi:hypothetical protein